MKKSLLLLLSACSLSLAPSSTVVQTEEVDENLYKDRDEYKLELNDFFTIGNFVCNLDPSVNILTFTVPITIDYYYTAYTSTVYYKFDDRGESLFSYTNLKSKITETERTYNLKVRLQSNNYSKVRFRIEINASQVNVKRTITFTIHTRNNVHDLSDGYKIYYRFSYIYGNCYNFFFYVKPTSFLKCDKNYYFYHKFSYEGFYLNMNDRGTTLGTGYMYIVDDSTVFLNCLTLIAFEDSTHKMAPLNLRRESETKQLQFTNKNQYYYDQKSNVMYKEKERTYGTVKDSFHLPRRMYDKFKETTIGILIKDFSSYKYSVRYEIKVTFEENYLPIDATIYKDEQIVTTYDQMEEIEL